MREIFQNQRQTIPISNQNIDHFIINNIPSEKTMSAPYLRQSNLQGREFTLTIGAKINLLSYVKGPYF